VVLTHANLLANVRAIRQAVEITATIGARSRPSFSALRASDRNRHVHSRCLTCGAGIRRL